MYPDVSVVSMSSKPIRIAVVGAGPGGLTLARLLHVAGIKTSLFERESSATKRPQGGTLDLHTESGQLALARARELGGAGGFYALQAAIAACHAEADTPEATDWRRIAALYGDLAALLDSPVIELNRAVAIGMAEGPQAALAIVDGLADEPALKAYHLLPSVRGDLLHRLNRFAEAHTAFEVAAALAGNAREREFLKRRAAVAARAAQDHGQR